MKKKIICNLGEGLILRHAEKSDEETLVDFNIKIHSEDTWDGKGLDAWVRDLVSGEGPTVEAGDFTIVEDTATGEIVSSCCHISQTWAYEGIPFKVGRPELVGTKKDYRKRGLIRKQFKILHQWSADRGELVQAITGIPYYYRLFGYEMTMNLAGGRAGYEIHVPELKEGQEEPYHFRLAAENDIPFLKDLYEHDCQRSMVWALWDEDQWRYELFGKRKYNINRREIYVIETREGKPAGFIGIPPVKWRQNSSLTLFEVSPDQSWSQVTPSVIRFLWKKGEALAKEQDQTQKMFGLWLGEDHPAYQVASSKLPRVVQPYSFYLRVPDLAAFLTTIKPVLEMRLAESPFANTTGELKLNFYRDGLFLDFEAGQLKTIKALSFDELENSSANFPPLTFLHMVFGYRTIDEIKHMHKDCSTKDEETAFMLDALFPKKASDVWAIS
jgi:hypothetical protein